MEQLNNGLLDFALIFSEVDRSQYHSLTLPQEDRFGVLMRRDSELAERNVITLADLEDKPLIISRASGEMIHGLMGRQPHIAATYNLIYNASLLVEDGLGYALGFDKLINVDGALFSSAFPGCCSHRHADMETLSGPFTCGKAFCRNAS